MKRNVLHSPRLLELKRERRREVLDKFLALLLGILVLFFAGAYFSRIPGLNIDEVEVTGNKIVETARIESLVEKEIEGKYLWLYPKSNALYYSKRGVEEVLLHEFPRIRDVELSVSRKTLTVSVVEREAKYTWCGPARNVESGRKEVCYFMDEEGFIFDEAPYFSGVVYSRFYGGEALLVNGPVGNYFSKESFLKIKSFKDILEDLTERRVAMTDVKGNGDVEMFLAREGSQATGPKIIWRSGTDITNVAENLQTALSTEPLLSGFKNRYSSLLYIDLRFGNKVYFKFNDARS